MSGAATTIGLIADAVEKTVVLAGNPNSGKTSIFNALTSGRQHVGNYAGVTVEKRDGSYESASGVRVRVRDLPGTYSLTSFSPEERVAQDELLSADGDVVVLVVDSTNLKRSLVLMAQVMQTGANIVLCLNMADEARAAGQRIDLPLMRDLLGFPVVETEGHRRVGIDELRAAIDEASVAPRTRHRLVLGERLPKALAKITATLKDTRFEPALHEWVATKLLVADEQFLRRAQLMGERGAAAIAEAERQRAWLEKDTAQEINLFVTERFFGFVDGLLREVMTRRASPDARAVSDKIDTVLVHRLLGLPIFATVMYAIFWITFTAGEMPMGWIESGFEWLGATAAGFWAPGADSALKSLLVDGMIGGVGGVIVFLPNILLLFFGLAFLEDTGYMARAAFLMDRLMHRFGLHGQSFIPMVTGFGCSIPGIMATRTLENERDRLTTMMVLPLMSCGARLPIWMLLIPAFFAPVWRAPMLWVIYASGIVLALLLALVLRKTLMRGEEAPFVMELPPYRLPTFRAVITKMVERGWIYVRKAGTVILAISILMWLITAYPKADGYTVDAEIAAGQVTVVENAPATDDAVTAPGDEAAQGPEVLSAAQVEERRAAEDLQASIAGSIGRAIEPFVSPLGFDWRLSTAMLGAFAAKEVFVAQLGIVYAMGETSEESLGLREQLRRDFPPLTGLSMMLFLLIATPCMATIAVTRRESGSWKWAMLQLFGLTAIAYVVSLAVFQIGSLFV